MRKHHGSSAQSAAKSCFYYRAVDAALNQSLNQPKQLNIMYKCPYCGEDVKEVYYHLNTYHFNEISVDKNGVLVKSSALLKEAVNNFKTVEKDDVSYFHCPVPACLATLKRKVSDHLRRVHMKENCNLPITEIEYKQYLKEKKIPAYLDKTKSPSSSVALARARYQQTLPGSRSTCPKKLRFQDIPNQQTRIAPDQQQHQNHNIHEQSQHAHATPQSVPAPFFPPELNNPFLNLLETPLQLPTTTDNYQHDLTTLNLNDITPQSFFPVYSDVSNTDSQTQDTTKRNVTTSWKTPVSICTSIDVSTNTTGDLTAGSNEEEHMITANLLSLVDNSVTWQMGWDGGRDPFPAVEVTGGDPSEDSVVESSDEDSSDPPYNPEDDADPLISCNDVKVTAFLQEFVDQYKRYRISAVGGRRQPGSGLDNECNRLLDMLLYIGATDSLQPLLEKDVFKEKLLNEYAEQVNKKARKGIKGKSEGTMMVYMTYLINALAYIQAEELEIRYNLDHVRIHASKGRFSKARRGYDKGAKRDKRVRESREADHIEDHLTIGNIRKCKQRSNESTSALFLLYGGPNCPPKVSQRDYCKMRDNLMANISFRVNQRDGVPVNLRYEELDRAKQIGNNWLVRVDVHKGAINHGSAPVSFPLQEMEKIWTFAEKVRPLLKGAAELFRTKKREDLYKDQMTKFVFAPWTVQGGTGKLQPGSNSKALTRTFKRTRTIPKGVHVTSTNIRMAGVAAMENMFPGDQDKRKRLAGSMCHDLLTSVRNYERRQKDKDGVEIQDLMEAIINGNLGEGGDSLKNETFKNDLINAILKGIKGKASAGKVKVTRGVDEEEEKEEETEKEDEDYDAEEERVTKCSDKMSPKRKKGRASYTDWDEEDSNTLSMMSPAKETTPTQILKETPEHIREKYGDERVKSKFRRLKYPSPKKIKNTSLLPECLQREKVHKQDSWTDEDEHQLYEIVKDRLYETADGTVEKQDKVTSIKVMKSLFRDSSMLKKFSYQQISTKLGYWVKKVKKQRQLEGHAAT